MWVTVWRHGEAGPASPDRARTLTPRGESSLKSAIGVFAQTLEQSEALPVERIVASPWRRTEQTAALLGRKLGIEIELDPRLAPDNGVASAAELISELDGHIMLVGHQPTVSDLLWYWLDNSQLPPLSPGGWATVSLPCHGRGMATLSDYRAAIF